MFEELELLDTAAKTPPETELVEELIDGTIVVGAAKSELEVVSGKAEVETVGRLMIGGIDVVGTAGATVLVGGGGATTGVLLEGGGITTTGLVVGAAGGEVVGDAPLLS